MVVMKSCVQRNSVYGRKDFSLHLESNPGPLDQQASVLLIVLQGLLLEVNARMDSAEKLQRRAQVNVKRTSPQTELDITLQSCQNVKAGPIKCQKILKMIYKKCTLVPLSPEILNLSTVSYRERSILMG